MYTGVAPAADIAILKGLNAGGSGSSHDLTECGNDIIARVKDGTFKHDIIEVNMSYGGGYYGPQEDQLQKADEMGIGNNAAAGNSGGGPGNPTCGHPGTTNYGTSVAAIGPDGQITNFSSQCKQVDIAAPGARVLSSTVGGRYGYNDGTSMACPWISGAKAILRQSMQKRGAVVISTASEWNEWFRANAIDRGRECHDWAYGNGVIDFGSLLTWLAQGSLKFFSLFMMAFLLTAGTVSAQAESFEESVTVVVTEGEVVETSTTKTTLNFETNTVDLGETETGTTSESKPVVMIRVQTNAKFVNVLMRKSLSESVPTFSLGAKHQWYAVPDPGTCLLYTSPSPRDRQKSRMPSSA